MKDFPVLWNETKKMVDLVWSHANLDGKTLQCQWHSIRYTGTQFRVCIFFLLRKIVELLYDNYIQSSMETNISTCRLRIETANGFMIKWRSCYRLIVRFITLQKVELNYSTNQRSNSWHRTNENNNWQYEPVFAERIFRWDFLWHHGIGLEWFKDCVSILINFHIHLQCYTLILCMKNKW